MAIDRETSEETAARFRSSYHGRARRAPQRSRSAIMSSARAMLGQRGRHIARHADRLAGLRSSTAAMFDALESAAWTPAIAVPRLEPLPPMVRIKETQAERLRRYRDAAIARGLCCICRCRPAKPGARYCVYCMGKAAERKRAEFGKRCQNCWSVLRGKRRGKALCARCVERDTDRNRRRGEVDTAAGICLRCRREPIASGHRHCTACLDLIKDAALALSRAAGRKPKWRSCSICTAAGIESMNHDKRTHDRWMERSKTWR
jgi:hypothetical protein